VLQSAERTVTVELSRDAARALPLRAGAVAYVRALHLWRFAKD